MGKAVPGPGRVGPQVVGCWLVDQWVLRWEEQWLLPEGWCWEVEVWLEAEPWPEAAAGLLRAAVTHTPETHMDGWTTTARLPPVTDVDFVRRRLQTQFWVQELVQGLERSDIQERWRTERWAPGRCSAAGPWNKCFKDYCLLPHHKTNLKHFLS